ncbi:MAG: rod shape-determining protein MreD [Acidobacteria bacterium]|nr:rod shape-determining protein MreD [Acidobacteriota bacterium]
MSYDDRILLSSRRQQISRFPGWVLIVVPLAAILSQVYLPLFFQFLGFLELPLLVTIYFSLMRGSPVSGIFIGMLVGLAQDSLSKNPLGMFGIVKTLVGYFAASASSSFDVEHPIIRLLLAFMFFVFHQFCYWTLTRVLLARELDFEWGRTFLLASLNAAVGLALFQLLDKLKERS